MCDLIRSRGGDEGDGDEEDDYDDSEGETATEDEEDADQEEEDEDDEGQEERRESSEEEEERQAPPPRQPMVRSQPFHFAVSLSAQLGPNLVHRWHRIVFSTLLEPARWLGEHWLFDQIF